MAVADPARADPALEDDDPVDLAFVGPEPVVAPSAPWHLRLFDLFTAYLPLVMMAVLAAGTWWLVRNAPAFDPPRAAPAPKHEPDYVMTRFTVQRFAPDGSMRTQIEGDTLRHYPDDDTLEIDTARIRTVADNGTVTLASAKRALANGDGSEVQLLGDARVVRPASGKEEEVEFRSEFLHAFRNGETVQSHLPVVMTQGTTRMHAEGLFYDNLARVVDLKGRTSASFAPKRK